MSFPLLLLALMSAPCGAPAAEQASVASSPTAAEIEAEVRKLNSDVYAERQLAMQKLRQGGVQSIGALVKAARGSNPEVSARAIQLLTQMYESSNSEVAIAADEALETLGESGPPMTVVRTQEALSTTLAPLRRRHAISAIQRLGGHVIATPDFDDEGREVPGDLDKEGSAGQVALGRKWKGGLAGIKYLQRLPELQRIYLTNATPLTPDEIGQLKQRLPSVSMEMRGAYLGIKSRLHDGEICVVENVVPGSPANLGGLLQGDVITHLDGLPVVGFAGLTGTLTQKQGGDVIYLEVLRDDEPVELTITLGEW